ncbi:MAG: cytochrome c2 [Verrucomicrobiales bacterium]
MTTPKHRKGFDLFRKNCMVCHAIDGSGGTMGPELHSPRNVTEYWKEEMIPAFVKKPQSFRHNAKMPPMGHLGDKPRRQADPGHHRVFDGAER